MRRAEVQQWAEPGAGLEGVLEDEHEAGHAPIGAGTGEHWLAHRKRCPLGSWASGFGKSVDAEENTEAKFFFIAAAFSAASLSTKSGIAVPGKQT